MKIVKGMAIGLVVAVVVTMFIVAAMRYLDRPTVVGIKFDDGGMECSRAYDANGPRDCEEVIKTGNYELVPIPPSEYKGPRFITGPAK